MEKNINNDKTSWTARKTDRRVADQRNVKFPLHLPNGLIIEKERRRKPDRRANAYISKQMLFREVAWEFAEHCLKDCPLINLEPGKILLTPEKENEHLYLVRSGRLKVHLDTPDSEGGFPIEEGDFTGDMSIIDGKRPSAYVVAEEPSEVIAVHKDVFWGKVTGNPAVAKNMLSMFVERIRHGNETAILALEKELRYEHLQKELKSAHDIQYSMLPKLPLFNELPQIKAYALMDAARDIGGDFYDALSLDERRIYMTIGDVSGKGMPAALFMMRTITVMRDCLLKGINLGEMATSVNNSLCENNDTNMFITVFIAIFDVVSGELNYVSGGHNPILIGNRQSGFEYLNTPKGILMGVMQDMAYQVETRTVQPGETLVLYTDGVTEAENPDKNIFGDETFRKLLATLPTENPEKLVKGVRDTLTHYAADAPQSDDITLFALHYLGR